MATTADVVVSPWLEGLLNKLDSPWMIKFGSEWGVQEQLIDLFRTLQEAHAMASSTEDIANKRSTLEIAPQRYERSCVQSHLHIGGVHLRSSTTKFGGG
uniref:Uncharacterized protein n=1 Tax=Nelumbo nucifera TaxID=4432 RepID=A0A822YJD1_NELNU|nr:TPA_asm: hypothetical protein HUJ06_011064 [Nelumbo nucifera]